MDKCRRCRRTHNGVCGIPPRKVAAGESVSVATGRKGTVAWRTKHKSQSFVYVAQLERSQQAVAEAIAGIRQLSPGTSLYEDALLLLDGALDKFHQVRRGK